jgi:NADH:ubiquinone oxidoreductase subunit 6 (subunit J)
MSAVLFFIAAIGVISGAVGVVVLRNPFFSVLALVVHLVSLAVLFLLLRAEFVAAVQVVVYAGAVMVLYVFVVAYVGGEAASIGERLLVPSRVRGPGARGSSSGPGLRLGGAILGGALLVELLIALLGTGLEAIDGYGAGYAPGPQAYGTPAYIGKLLLTRFLLAFEVASFLLLIAAVGGVVLARRRGGLEDEDERELLAPLHGRLPQGTGSMAEGVGRAGHGSAVNGHDAPLPRRETVEPRA